MAAKVDESKCTGCGSCSEVCPVDAIVVDQVAKIDASICIDCSACVATCPNEAISLEEIRTAAPARNSYVPPPSPAPEFRGQASPNPSPARGGQPEWRQVNNRGGLFSQIFGWLGRSAGPGGGTGLGGGMGGRGKGGRGRSRHGKGRRGR